jgi:hypothetical protein
MAEICMKPFQATDGYKHTCTLARGHKGPHRCQRCSVDQIR